MFRSNVSRCVTGLLILGLVAVSALTVQAATVVWTGGTDSTWDNTANWSTGAMPQNTDVAAFTSLSTANLSTITLDGGDRSVLGLQETTPGGDVTIGGNNILNIGTSGIDMTSSTNNLTLNCNVALGGPQSWTVNNGETLTVGGSLSGSSNLTKLGKGLLTLNGVNSFSGTLTIGSATAQAGVGLPPGNGANANASGGVIIGNGAALQSANVFIYGGDPNTRSMGVVFGPGVTTATFASLASYGVGPLSLMTTDPTPVPVTLTVGGNNASTTFNGAIWSYTSTGVTTLSQAGTLVKTGNGTLTLNDGNGNDYYSYEGSKIYQGIYNLNIAAGEVMLTGMRCLPGCDEPYNGPGMPGAITFNGGMLGINFTVTDGWDQNAINRDITGTNFNGGFDIVPANMSLPLNTQLTGTGSFTKAGAGTVILGVTWQNNSYTGGTVLTGGSLQLGGTFGMGNSGPLTVTDGTLDLCGFSPTVGGARRPRGHDHQQQHQQRDPDGQPVRYDHL